MGNGASASFESALPAIPDTEFTVCAILLKRMGIRVVVFGFENTVLVMPPDLRQQLRLGHHWALNQYTEPARRSMVMTMAQNIPDTVCTFMVSLITQGITVVLLAEHSDARNGEVTSSEGKSGFLYEGGSVMRRVMDERLGPEIAKFVHIEDSGSVSEALRKFEVRHKSEALLVHSDPDMVRRARKQHMGGILIEDHALGFRL